jgi:hypothetical protein
MNISTATPERKTRHGRRVNLDTLADAPQTPPGYAERIVTKQAPTEADLAWQAAAGASDRDKWVSAYLKVSKDLARIEDHLGTLPDEGEDALTAFSAGTMTAAEFAAQDLPEQTWIVPGMIPAGGLGLLLAAEKTGKSLLALDCGIAVAQGAEFCGQHTSQTNVLFIEQEGAPAALQRRIRKMTGYTTPPSNLIIRHRKPLDLTDPKHLAGLRAYIIEHNIGLVFVGPLAQIGNLEDENSAAGINQIAKDLLAIITTTGATIVLIHHRKKPGQNDSYSAVGSFFTTSRGSSALMAAVDFAIGLQRAQEDPIGKMFVLLRDDASSMSNYRFDLTTLRITPTDEKPAKKTEQHMSAVIAHMIDNPEPIMRYIAESSLGLGKSTASTVFSEGVRSGRMEMIGAGKTTAYILTAQFREAMERDPKAQNGLTLLAGGAK